MTAEDDMSLLPRLVIVKGLAADARSVNNPDTARLNARGTYIDGMVDLILMAACVGNEGYHIVKAMITREMSPEEFEREITALMWQDHAPGDESA